MNRVIFLGTGSAAHPTRQMTSLLFVISGRGILVDCGDGMGTVRQIIRAGVALSSVNDVFLTHNHADHIIGMPHFLFVKLITEPHTTIRVFGPRRTLAVVRRISFATHDYIQDHADRVSFIPVSAGATVQPYPDVSVTAARMHSVKGSKAPGFAYAVSAGVRRIMFSADTMPGPRMAALAQGVHTLIHECGGFDRDRERIHAGGHSTARDAGELAAKAGVQHLILTHFPRPDHAKPQQLAVEAGKYFKGKISLAEDLKQFDA